MHYIPVYVAQGFVLALRPDESNMHMINKLLTLEKCRDITIATTFKICTINA